MEVAFLKNYTNIIVFVILTILISLFLGDQALFWFLLLVFIGQILINVDKIKTNLSKI